MVDPCTDRTGHRRLSKAVQTCTAADGKLSNLNPAAGQTVANMAMVALNEVNKFNIYNNAGTTNVIVDVAGRFDISPNLLGAPSTFSGRTSPSAATSQVAPLR